MTRYVRVVVDGQAVWAIEDERLHLLSAAPWFGGERMGIECVDAPRLGTFEGSKIIGIGSNYRDHAAEMGKPVPLVPKLFLKAPSAVIGAGEAIEIPPGTMRVDHEAELGIVIGRRCRRVSERDALDHVFGCTAVNDVTARDFQREDGTFARGKGFDSFCPVGPAVVTGLTFEDRAVGASVNDRVRQAGNTRDMVFTVAQLIAFCSAVMTLEPGDLIATGTPAGVGPLVAGDVVIVRVDGVGALVNPVVNRADR